MRINCRQLNIKAQHKVGMEVGNSTMFSLTYFGNQKGLLPFSAAGNGLLQGLLGTTLEDQPPTTAVQQSKIPVQNGGYSEDKNHVSEFDAANNLFSIMKAAKIPTAFWEGGENPKVTGLENDNFI
jgi:hypothetical protein